MELKITRWNGETPPSEGELRRLYRLEQLTPYVWSNDPGDEYGAHDHPYDKVLMVVSGSITWILPNKKMEIETFAGDRVDLPRGVTHAARVGPHGVTCLEAHRLS